MRCPPVVSLAFSATFWLASKTRAELSCAHRLGDDKCLSVAAIASITAVGGKASNVLSNVAHAMNRASALWQSDSDGAARRASSFWSSTLGPQSNLASACHQHFWLTR